VDAQSTPDFPSMPLSGLSRKAFWVIARSGLAIYSRLPLFGTLNAAIGVLRMEDKFLVIDRNDGRGVSFPGGLKHPWESAEQALIREVREETGLQVTSSVFALRYYSAADIPVNVNVFEIEASGQLRDSWEGLPCWLGADDLRLRLLTSQQRILEFVK
jgi:8-oxo-dGTP pyrophosphatase MutT (NUDIX family)